MKRLLAYSSIENIGVILPGRRGLGKASGNQLVALWQMTGALLHTLNHSFFKSLLFFGAGNILSQTHTTSLDALGGLSKHMPLTSILFLTGTAAICALPPLNGFVRSLLVYLGLLDGIASGEQRPRLGGRTGGPGTHRRNRRAGLHEAASTASSSSAHPARTRWPEASEVDNLRIAAMALPLAGILRGALPRAAVAGVTRAADFFLRTPADAADWLLSPTLTAAGRIAWLLLLVVGILLWLRRRSCAAAA